MTIFALIVTGILTLIPSVFAWAAFHVDPPKRTLGSVHAALAILNAIMFVLNWSQL